ncbi:unnamed protein product [Caenorhabditis auriculariae]|uniref:WD repeat-containing protein 89 n=1 Tax=Caenorhabditis auriculariae TaxID=2777116 RepID=A0A8S1H2S7_9PELO|nr:unnamed protein product [Caenorhabditis auriculariae]
MPRTVEISRSKVRSIVFGGSETVAVALQSDLIPLVDLEKGTVKRTIDVAKKIAGIHFAFTKTPVLYAVDDSFGVHVFDIRADSKKKLRLNPDVENHQAKCSAISDNYIAIASSCFIQPVVKKRKNQKEYSDDEEDTMTSHVISIFDARNPCAAVMTLSKYHPAEITSMAFDRKGVRLAVGDSAGNLNMFDLLNRKKPQIVPPKQLNATVLTNGFISRVVRYALTADNTVHSYVDDDGGEDILFVKKFPDNEHVIHVMKGSCDDFPVDTISTNDEGKLFIRTIEQDGEEVRLLKRWSGHKSRALVAAYNDEIVVTGGSDGLLVINPVDLSAGADVFINENEKAAEKRKKDPEEVKTPSKKETDAKKKAKSSKNDSESKKKSSSSNGVAAK